jgi:hypothetical protein
MDYTPISNESMIPLVQKNHVITTIGFPMEGWGQRRVSVGVWKYQSIWKWTEVERKVGPARTNSYSLLHRYSTLGCEQHLLPTPYRWNPLNIDWGTSNNTPPLMYHGNSYPITLDAQNTGEFDWWLLDDWALSYRWSKTGFSEIRSNNRAWTSSYVSKGSNYTFNPTINDIPDWGAGTYTLKFDMIRGLSGGESWFGDPPNAWETYNVTICVDEPCNVIEGKENIFAYYFQESVSVKRPLLPEKQISV